MGRIRLERVKKCCVYDEQIKRVYLEKFGSIRRKHRQDPFGGISLKKPQRSSKNQNALPHIKMHWGAYSNLNESMQERYR